MIIQINKRDGFSTFQNSNGDWFYTREDVKKGSYTFDWHFGHYGRRWATNIRPLEKINHDQLSKEFRERVSNARRLPN